MRVCLYRAVGTFVPTIKSLMARRELLTTHSKAFNSCKEKEMKTTCIILLLFNLAYSQDPMDDQLGTIKGGGSINIRSKPDGNSEILGQLHIDGIFYYYPSEAKDGWSPIEYGIDTSLISKEDREEFLKHFSVYCNSIYIKGYIPEIEIQPLCKLPEIKFEKHQRTETFISLKNDSMTFFASSANFDPAKHILSTVCDEEYIDGLRVWGRDPGSGLPMVQISSIRLTLFGKEIQISKSEFSNLYEPNFREFYFYLSKRGGIFFHMMNSDGGGVYDAVFLIRDGKCKLIFVDINPYVLLQMEMEFS
jgi:hypothetical protein